MMILQGMPLLSNRPQDRGETRTVRAGRRIFTTANAVGLTLALYAGAATAAVAVKDVRPKMGSPFEVTAVAEDEAAARAAVEAAYVEIDRIEARISTWIESSEASALNARAGSGPIAVSQELFELIRRALKVSELTDGAFDVTFAAVGRLWDFKAKEPRLPEPEALKEALSRVGWERVQLDIEARTIALEPGMGIGFGGIGKGYAANRGAAVLEASGATGGFVSAGGDIMAFGLDENGEPWRIAIADPVNQGSTFAHLDLTDQAVVTSGDYERYVEIDGQRYTHILDPRTGYPVRGVRAVTVVCPDAELADALATSVFVLGPDKGLALIDQLRGVEALVVDDAGEIHLSSRLESSFVSGVEEP